MSLLLGGFLSDLFDSVGSFFGTVFGMCVAFCVQNPLDPASWASFSWVTAATLYVQALALAIVVALRIVSGVVSGIFANGGDPDTGESPAQWLFHSLWTVGLVCALPSLVKWIAGLAAAIAQNLNDIAEAADFTSYPGKLDGAFGDAAGALMGADPAANIVKFVLLFVCLYYMGSILVACMGRQIQLVVMSVIAPFTCITAAGDDMNMADVSSICRDMLWVGVNNGLQLALLSGAVGLSMNSGFIHVMGPLYPLAAVAMFKAVKDVPGWIEKWTPNQVQAGRMGGKAAGFAAGVGRMAAMRHVLGAAK